MDSGLLNQYKYEDYNTDGSKKCQSNGETDLDDIKDPNIYENNYILSCGTFSLRVGTNSIKYSYLALITAILKFGYSYIRVSMFGKFNKFRIIQLYPASDQVPPHTLNLHEIHLPAVSFFTKRLVETNQSPGFKPNRFHYKFLKCS